MSSQLLSKAILVRTEIDELLNQIKHLERSQIELQAAILDDVNDEDFQLAYIENEQVIRDKTKKVTKLKEKLRQIDPAYRSEVVVQERLQIRVNSSSIQPNDLESLANETISTISSEAPTEGVYL